MFHLAAWSANQAIGATNVALTAIADQVLSIVNNQYIFKTPMKLQAAYGLGTGISRARINAPSFRVPFLPSIQPLDTATAPPDLPAVSDYRDQELMIPEIDQVAPETTNTDAGAQQHTVGMWLAPEGLVKPTGPVFTARFTFNITGVAFAWVLGNITFEQGLPEGEYEVVGLSVIGAGLIFARLFLPGQTWRPGVVGRTAEGNDERFLFRMGRMGSFGQFRSFAQPQLEILANAAGAINNQGYVDLIKIA